MARHNAGAARVVPIVLRPVDWQDAPFGKLQALPKNAKPVTTWPNQDEAFLDIAQGIRRTVASLRGGSAASSPLPSVAATPTASPASIDTGGGAYIGGNANTGGGKFVGRDDRT